MDSPSSEAMKERGHGEEILLLTELEWQKDIDTNPGRELRE